MISEVVALTENPLDNGRGAYLVSDESDFELAFAAAHSPEERK